MAITINAKLNVAVNAQSLGPAISSIQNAFQGKKIPLEVSIKIPNNINSKIYAASRAFEVLDKRMISLKMHSAEALGGVQAFIANITGVGQSFNKSLTPAVK